MTAKKTAPKSAPAAAKKNTKKGAPAPKTETPVAKKSGTPAAQHPRDETGAGFAYSAPRRAGENIDPLGYNVGSRGNVVCEMLAKLSATHPGMTAGELTAVAGPLTKKGATTEDSIRAALSHAMHRGFVVLYAGNYSLTTDARKLLTSAKK